MSNSNYRITDYETVHHLTSRIAHRVFFLKEDERNDFQELMLRIAHFCGLRLLGWCIMENHFHILVYLPAPETLPQEEVISRYRSLSGVMGRDDLACDFDRWAKQGETGAMLINDAVRRLRKRMYSIAWFMKLVKQWFTEGYNRRNSHKGTMWESTYHDRVIFDLDSQATHDCLCYIHLNPIRATITPDFEAYPWSSLTAARKGDPVALSGLRMTYGGASDDNELFACHHKRMHELLEGYKMRQAEKIVRKRAAGYPVPSDPLTSAAMVAQAQAAVEKRQQEIIELHAARQIEREAAKRRKMLAKEILLVHRADPSAKVEAIARMVEEPLRKVYRYLKKLRHEGLLAA